MPGVSGNERLVYEALTLRDEMANRHPHFTPEVVCKAAATSAIDSAVLRGEVGLSDWPEVSEIVELADKLIK